MQKYVRQATPEDAHKLAPKMRNADREEIKASHNSTPLNALLFPFTQLKHKTFTIIGTEEEDVIGMFGVVPCETKDYGIAWLLSSEELLNHTRQFLRECPKWVNEMSKDYKYLYNYVDERNIVAIKWLQFLGFKVIETLPYGYEKKNFKLMLKEIN